MGLRVPLFDPGISCDTLHPTEELSRVESSISMHGS
jgi:hypothetical protein